MYPAAVKVYHETEYAIGKLTALRKYIWARRKDAMYEARVLLQRLARYLVVSEAHDKYVVAKNKKIMSLPQESARRD